MAAETNRRPVNRLTVGLAILTGSLMVLVLVLSLAQMGMIMFGDEIAPYIRVRANPQSTDLPDKRGTFARQAGTFYEMLGFSFPAIEILSKAVRVPQAEMDGIFVHRAAPEDEASFFLYRVPLDELQRATQASVTGKTDGWAVLNEKAVLVPVKVDRIRTTTVVRMQPATGSWEPGGYMLRLPAEGTAIGTYWFYFVVV